MIMSDNTKKLIILVLVILFASWLMSIFCGLTTFSLFRNNSVSIDGKTYTIRGSFNDIDIKTQTGSIRLYESRDRSAKAVWSGPKSMKLEVKTKGNTLSIKEKYKLPWFLRLGFDFSQAGTLDIYLPKGNYAELRVQSDTGSIRIPSGFSFTSANIETDTGAIDFQARVNGPLKIDSDTGSIKAAGISPESLELKSDTGSITVDNMKVSKDASIKTATGRNVLTNVACRDLKVESDTGSITLTDVIAAGQMEIDSDTGSVTLDRCEAAAIDIDTDTGAIRGTLLSDKVFYAKSDTGKVSVPESTSGGTCKIESDTGSIEITITNR